MWSDSWKAVLGVFVAIFGTLFLLAWCTTAHSAPRDPLTCLTQNIYFEAAGEPDDGKIAVAQVTLNRSQHDPGRLCDVVYARSRAPDGRTVAAFSWTLGAAWRSRGPLDPVKYSECRFIALAMLYGALRSSRIGPEVLSYHTDTVHPRWHKKFVVKIGRHLFYRG
jgi:spore germination cell wall hydrolase CwlJ-like protein